MEHAGGGPCQVLRSLNSGAADQVSLALVDGRSVARVRQVADLGARPADPEPAEAVRKGRLGAFVCIRGSAGEDRCAGTGARKSGA